MNTLVTEKAFPVVNIEWNITIFLNDVSNNTLFILSYPTEEFSFIMINMYVTMAFGQPCLKHICIPSPMADTHGWRASYRRLLVVAACTSGS